MALNAHIYAQNVGISATGSAPNNDAGLDVDFNDRGVLIPRVSLSSITTYNPPIIGGGNVTSLLVYNTNATIGVGYYYWNGSRWVKLLVSGNPSDAWLINGNSNTNPSTHFIGTTDNAGLSIKTNNNEVMRLTPNARVGIGNSFPYFKLDITDTLDWGGLQVVGTKNAQLIINTPNNYIPQLTYIQSGNTRFSLNVANNGDYWAVGRFNNTGNYVESNLFVNRSTGYVGINRAYPSTIFHVYGGVPNLVIIERSTPNNANIQYQNPNGIMYAGIASSADWAIGTNVNLSSNPYFTVKYTNGYVGIGTNNPATLTHIHSSSNTTLRITSSSSSQHKGIQMGSTDGWYIGENNLQNFVINRDVPLGTGTNVFTIYSSGQPRMSHFVSRNSGVSGNGSNNDGPTNVIIEAASSPGRYNDWPNGWGGGLSTWDICGSSIYMTGYITRSDRAFKSNINPIEINDELLSKFMQLNPVTYRFSRESIKSNEWDYNRMHYGFIANEVENIFPDIVVNAGLEPSIKRGLEYNAFIPILVKIVQNQQKTIEYLLIENKKIHEELKNLQSK